MYTDTQEYTSTDVPGREKSDHARNRHEICTNSARTLHELPGNAGTMQELCRNYAGIPRPGRKSAENRQKIDGNSTGIRREFPMTCSKQPIERLESKPDQNRIKTGSKPHEYHTNTTHLPDQGRSSSHFQEYGLVPSQKHHAWKVLPSGPVISTFWSGNSHLLVRQFPGPSCLEMLRSLQKGGCL